jgi:protein-S-isoprenylcysteine O-methyltransferase Ste14
MFNFINIRGQLMESLRVFSIASSLVGLLVILISLVNLGDSTSLGLPSENTTFKEGGLYKLSRNPMYLGFNVLTISSVLLCANSLITVLGIYSIVIYHFIVIGEEEFLQQRFGEEYAKYMKRVRRYI